MQFYCLVENNDWEGETWKFYFPVEGNEKETKKLNKFIDGENYILSEKIYTEEEVDILCTECLNHITYMPTHNKLNGKLSVKGKKNNNPLYKGGIRDMIKLGKKNAS